MLRLVALLLLPGVAAFVIAWPLLGIPRALVAVGVVYFALAALDLLSALLGVPIRLLSLAMRRRD